MTRLFCLLLAVLLAASVSVEPAEAAPGAAGAGSQQRRLQIQADLVREARVEGVERGRTRLVQRVDLQVLLVSDGVPSASNPLDPDDGRRLAARGQRTAQKVQAAMQRVGAPPPSDPAAAMAQAQANMAQAQAMMARCGQDRDCLMREAMARVPVSGPQAGAVQGRLETYGGAVRACERQHAAAAAREACIAQARRQAGGSDDSDADEVPETPYLVFHGAAACQVDAATRIDERVEASFDDVQGVVPFTQTTQADGRERDALLCPLMQAVLDTRNGRLWTRVLPALRGVPARTVRAEKGRRPQQNDELLAPRWHEAQDWLQGRLENLSAGGNDRHERSLPGGKLELRLSWRFAPA